MTDKKSKRLMIIFGAAVLALLAAAEIYKALCGWGEDFDVFYQIISRIFGGAVFILFIRTTSFKKILTPRLRSFLPSILFALPCFAVALNNFPFYSYFRGTAEINAGAAKILLLALTCLSVGFFEEVIFRGGIFMVLLEHSDSKKKITGAVIKSSAVFGLIHAVNLFFGASPLYVLLQIGYSFLIGGMCAVLLLKTGNLPLCVIIHALYNFSGALVPELGGGEIWETPTVILTVIISVAAAVYIIGTLIKITPRHAARLFAEKT